ncbi:alpha-galactosidase [Sphingomonas gei]|uniref:Alpha-galactosidase n=1 Tax=Sphingomonas gei TaxID=1395960 RepID=A0A4S1X0Z5_9SPHN|nr:glycoside hydrolase family 36 protein [Sphingomonas gei]TGX49584.1 alpha-galactosidase [Sphingomonas gei]
MALTIWRKQRFGGGTCFVRQACMLLTFAAAVTHLPAGAQTAPASLERSVVVQGFPLSVSGDLKGFDLDIDVQARALGVDGVVLTLSRATQAPPPRLMLRWSMPSVNMSGMWTPDAGLGRTIVPDFADVQLRSTLTAHAPVLALYGRDERNRMTVSVSDALNPVLLSARLREEDVRVYQTIELFTEPHAPLKRYRVELRFDSRPLPFSTVLRDVAQWWAKQPGYAPSPAPAAAAEPLDSTWYSYHQNVPDDLMRQEAAAAAKRGFKVMIVDDGWQTNDGNRGYAFVGDWKPERLRQMRAFTDTLHGLNMKGMLWFSVPFVGDNSEAFRRFRGKTLRRWNEQSTNVLDPRYPEVRAYLIETFRRAVVDWGWDGLKLDFIDSFKSDDKTVLEAGNGRDYASVYEAVDRLMTDIMAALRAAKPDVLIEFRQAYTGPLIRKYGNMLRASDAPNSSILNRQRIVDLRLLSGSTPVHADPVVWNHAEPVEQAALQLLDTLFAVPQISVRLAGLTPGHSAMLERYLSYWRANRDVLLSGDFRPEGIGGDYLIVRAVTAKKQIIGLYSGHLVTIDKVTPAIDVVNATQSRNVLLYFEQDAGRFQATTRDAYGRIVNRSVVRLTNGPHLLDMPASGILELSR